jgi:hypothetical protein
LTAYHTHVLGLEIAVIDSLSGPQFLIMAEKLGYAFNSVLLILLNPQEFLLVAKEFKAQSDLRT